MFGRWIYGVVCASMISAAAILIAPECSAKRAVKLACGLLIAASLLSPVSSFNYTTFSKSLASLRAEADGLSERMRETNEKLTALIIEQECAAYIVDKSARLGVRGLDAEVSAEWSADGFWYPVEARLSGEADDGARAEICRFAESELGISPERVIWMRKD
ncbi:MAG: hypothetical protein LBD49_05310 [Oscillospiraceae bacterium]|jgi:hypothetical protein|nr:hypothetical protein [Oscillospiraceae bacterium]